MHEWTISWENSLIMIAAGALIGIRTGWSMLAGAVVNYLILAPSCSAAGHRAQRQGTARIPPGRGLVAVDRRVDHGHVRLADLRVQLADHRPRVFRPQGNFGSMKVETDPRMEAMEKVEVPAPGSCWAWWFRAPAACSSR